MHDPSSGQNGTVTINEIITIIPGITNSHCYWTLLAQ